MGVGRVPGLLLLLVVLLTMPRAQAEICGEREYFHEGRCCVFCDAGTFVADHCSASHLRGKCDPCEEGKDFTAYENGLEECLPCRQCKEDQITVRPCTLTQNAECQCKQGYFCADEGCETCQRHSQMHPDREEIMPNCSDATDPGCGLPSQGKGALVWVIPVVGLFLLGLLIFVLKKLKCDKAASPDKDAEGGLKEIVENSVVSERGTIPCRGWKCHMTVWFGRIAKSSLPAKPVQNSDFQQNAPSNVPSGTPANCKVREPKCQITVKDLSQRELRDTFEVFIKEVLPQQWKQLMETRLQENDIDKIISKFPDNREEQSYQMLLIWRNKLGKKQCIINLLDELRHIDTKAYYNISSTLKSNNIISEVEAED